MKIEIDYSHKYNKSVIGIVEWDKLNLKIMEITIYTIK